MSSTVAFEAAQQAQRIAALPERSAWVEAHAGSGKTKVLIDRVARLLLRREDGRQGAAPDTILCITYTKAAANEMLSRLFKTLGDWSVADDEKLRDELSKLESRPVDAYQPEDLDAARALFANALETPGGLRIETIHAFCSRILRRFPLEADVSPGFGEIEDREADRLWAESLREQILHAHEYAPDALVTLSQIGGGNGAASVLSHLRSKAGRLAGADTDDLKHRVLAFLNAPEDSVDTLLQRALDADFQTIRVRSILAELQNIDKLGKADLTLLEKLPFIMSDASLEDRWATYASLFLTSSGDWRKTNPYTKPTGNALPALADLFQIKDGDGTETARFRALSRAIAARQCYEQTAALLDVGLPVLRDYAAGKTQRAALDFDDLILRTRDLLTAPGTAEWVLYKLDGGLTHILLDEAQDTSPDQWVLINALVEEFRAGKGADHKADPRTQFTVGDKKQSIYSFQGADPERFIHEKRRFIGAEEALHGQANLPAMTMSFRSTSEVLGFVDSVFNLDKFGGDPFSVTPPDEADTLQHVARRADEAGRVELWPIVQHTESEEDDPWDSPVDKLPEASPRNRLALNVATEIAAMIERGDPVWDRGDKRPVSPEDILILVRKRGPLFDALIRELKEQNLPVAGADRLVLLDHIAVQDCLNLLRFALFPSDDLTLAEILRGPFCGLVDDNNELFVLAHKRARGETLWDRLRTHTDPRFAAARAFCQSLLDNKHLPAFDFLSEVLNTRREDGRSGWDHIIQRLGEPARDPVNALISHALGFDMGEAASLQTFLAEIESDTSQLKRDLAEPNGEIRVMTVHGAKGLQAPIVFLPDTTGSDRADSSSLFMVEDDLPIFSASKSADPPELEPFRTARDTAQARESRRLLYVALTRAQDRLIIGGAFAGRRTGKGYSDDSWYALCRDAMLDLTGEAGEATDDDKVLTYGATLPPVSKDAAPKRPPPSAPDWARQPAAKDTAQRISAPSRLLEDKARVAKPFGKARSAALERGRLIHTLLQYLPDLPEPARNEAATSYLERHTSLEPAARTEILQATLDTLATPGFAHVFAPGGRSEAAIVGTIDSGGSEIIINGRADRLVISDDEILIIDYKTDRPAPDSAEDVDAAYLLQMAAYQAVLEKAFKGRPVRPALLYTDGPRLIELSDSLLQNSRDRLASGL
ncbi:double-strand break repair helicase AddA [Henriciella litoralis]|uniref:double-strand break repair helicase AddA n=1 Tax=Henriciella litoralis TaxID=568102 RepID=UPI00146F6118|nr:double-strand break repair helicase AddA [Henriciella litoralis]